MGGGGGVASPIPLASSYHPLLLIFGSSQGQCLADKVGIVFRLSNYVIVKNCLFAKIKISKCLLDSDITKK